MLSVDVHDVSLNKLMFINFVTAHLLYLDITNKSL